MVREDLTKIQNPKETQMTTRQNVNIDTLEGFRTFLKDNPDNGKLHLEAKAVYEGQAGRSMIHVGPFAVDDTTIDRPTRHYTFPFGAWREVEDMIGMEGATDRMEPVEMALASTAACLINSITLNAARLGIDTAGLEITVRTTVDPRVLLALKGPEEHGSCLGTIEYDVKVSGEVSDEDMDTIHKLCRYSPVHGMMAETIDIKGEVSRA
jgi:uncharacterized OsmC-like protein